MVDIKMVKGKCKYCKRDFTSHSQRALEYNVALHEERCKMKKSEGKK